MRPVVGYRLVVLLGLKIFVCLGGVRRLMEHLLPEDLWLWFPLEVLGRFHRMHGSERESIQCVSVGEVAEWSKAPVC
jgi:hypothetical protein